MKEIAVLYSGGTDSTAAVVSIAKQFNKIHLITFKHSGLFSIESSRSNVEKLREKFEKVEFVHNILEIARAI